MLTSIMNLSLESFRLEQDKAYKEWHESDQGTLKSCFLYGRYDAIREIVDNLEDSQGSPEPLTSEM